MTDAHEAQQLGGFAFIILFLPLYLLVPIIQNPNGTIAVAFSFFPLTSVTTIALRSLLMQVPTWQVTVAFVVTLACGVFMVWVAGRAFQTSMLRYGRRTNLRELFTIGRRHNTPAAPASGSPRSA